MRTTLTTVSIALAMAASACVGSLSGSTPVGGDDGSGSDPVDPPPGGGSGSGGGSATARDYFNANVYPVLLQSCGASSCHSATTPGGNAPPFVNVTAPTTDSSAAWNTITALGSVVGSYTPSAPLLSIPNTTSHYAKFTPTQTTTITNWLALEQTWRASSGGGTTAIDYMAQFTGCMQYDDFVTAGVAQAYAKQVDTNQGYCENCHVNGQAQSYMIATPDSANMFGAMTEYREYLSTFFTIDTTAAGSGAGSGSASPTPVIVNLVPFQLAADGGVNGEHPVNWDPTNNKGMTAMNKFYTLTVAHMTGTAPGCGSSTLSD
jgi:hypothetical protein